MTLFQAALLVAAFLCSLVAGFLFAFAAVVMPGLRSLDDGGFIRAFQIIDGALFLPSTRFIQRHQGQVRTRRQHGAPDRGLARAWQDFFVGAVEVALAGPSLDWVRAFRARID